MAGLSDVAPVAGPAWWGECSGAISPFEAIARPRKPTFDSDLVGCVGAFEERGAVLPQEMVNFLNLSLRTLEMESDYGMLKLFGNALLLIRLVGAAR
jgi:hypothetical protein